MEAQEIINIENYHPKSWVVERRIQSEGAHLRFSVYVIASGEKEAIAKFTTLCDPAEKAQALQDQNKRMLKDEFEIMKFIHSKRDIYEESNPFETFPFSELFEMETQESCFVGNLITGHGRKKTVGFLMRYYIHGSLESNLQFGELCPLDEKLAKFFVARVLRAVLFLHNILQLMHFDIKPANLLLDHKYDIYVSDFGQSRNYPYPDPKSPKALNLVMIKASHSLGTPYFHPPEICERYPVYNPLEIDIFSCGAMLFYLLAGKPCSYLDNAVIDRLYFYKAFSKHLVHIGLHHQTFWAMHQVIGNLNISVETQQLLDQMLKFQVEIDYDSTPNTFLTIPPLRPIDHLIAEFAYYPYTLLTSQNMEENSGNLPQGFSIEDRKTLLLPENREMLPINFVPFNWREAPPAIEGEYNVLKHGHIVLPPD